MEGGFYYYDLLDEDKKQLAREVAAEYPFTTEQVARIIANEGYKYKDMLRARLNIELIRKWGN